MLYFKAGLCIEIHRLDIIHLSPCDNLSDAGFPEPLQRLMDKAAPHSFSLRSRCHPYKRDIASRCRYLLAGDKAPTFNQECLYRPVFQGTFNPRLIDPVGLSL